MQKEIGKNRTVVISFRRMLYTVCFCMFCVIDQRVRTAYLEFGLLATFRDLTGVVMAVIILSHYKWKDFQKWKIPYLIWSVTGIVAGVAAYIWGVYSNYILSDWLVLIIAVFLFGYIVIHILIDLFVEKKHRNLNWKFALLWLLMMLMMIFSRSKLVWPFFYLVMFGCFYLTDYDDKEREDMLQGALDGIILGFFILQGLAFVFRPYDEVRYKGIYFNTNVNALFYIVVFTAVLAKLLFAYKRNAGKWLKLYYWLGAGVVLSFLFMTVGRTAWITAFLLFLVFLWAGKVGRQKGGILKKSLVVVLCFCLTFPVCFGAARYLPPLFHHPIWYGNEWNSNRVTSWDPWNSEKYIEIDELMDAAVYRVWDTIQDIMQHSPFLLIVNAAEVQNTDSVKVSRKGINVRLKIYRYYLSHLNLWGNSKEDGEWGYHAHNIFLQIGSDFGLVALGIFIVIYAWSLIVFTKCFLKKKEEKYAVYLLFALVPLLYGMLENVWGAGSNTVLIMFFTWGVMVHMGNHEITQFSELES